MASTPADPPSQPTPRRPHHVIESLSIEGGTHFASERLDLFDGMNCFIGAIGSGKSTLIQSLRYAAGHPATGPHAASNDGQVDTTLGTGTVTVTVRTQHGKRYTSRRRVGQPPIVTDERGEPVAVSLDSELFKIEVYSQSEISTMTGNRAAQLALIDKFADGEIRAATEAVAQVDRGLAQNAAEVQRLERDIEDGVDRTRELPSVAAALEGLRDAAGPDAALERAAHDGHVLRGREAAMLSELREEHRAMRAAAGAFEAEARRRLGAPLASVFDGSANRDLLAGAHAPSLAVVAVVHDGMEQVRRALAGAEGAVTAAGDALAAAHAPQNAAYEVVARRHEADREKLAQRERLQQRFLTLESFKKRLEHVRTEYDARLADRRALLAERDRLLEARCAVRRRVCEQVTRDLDNQLVVTILPGGDTSLYFALLEEMLKGANIRPSSLIKTIAESIRPDELAAMVRANKTEAIQAIDDSQTNKAERAQRVIDSLRASGRVAELDTVPLPDLPVIHLMVDEEPVPAHELSFGQRCTAILPILLLLAESVLIIDQPEDQLDSRFIYSTLLRTLHNVKLSRQLIFATHNANILVLGGTDRVFVVDAPKRKGRIHERGTVDEVRESVELVVEGGREAFLRRKERYGH